MYKGSSFNILGNKLKHTYIKMRLNFHSSNNYSCQVKGKKSKWFNIIDRRFFLTKSLEVKIFCKINQLDSLNQKISMNNNYFLPKIQLHVCELMQVFMPFHNMKCIWMNFWKPQNALIF